MRYVGVLLFAMGLAVLAVDTKPTTGQQKPVPEPIPELQAKFAAMEGRVKLLEAAIPQGKGLTAEEIVSLRAKIAQIRDTDSSAYNMRLRLAGEVLDVLVGTYSASPTPNPPPQPPKGIAKHITFIGATAETAALVNSQALRTWFKEKGVAVHVYPGVDATVVEKGLRPTVDSQGGPPVLILQAADGKVLDASRITSGDVAWVKAFVGSYLEK